MFVDNIGEAFIEWADPESKCRVDREGWFLCDFRSAVTLVALYLFMAIFGPNIAANIPIIDAYPMKFVYNASQIFLCAYMSVEAGLLVYRYGHSAIPDTGSSKHQPVSFLMWLFYMSKAWDFMDTVFFVIERRWRQLSFLHVYHHAGTFLLYWFNANVICNGDVMSINYLTLCLNGFIHTVMYTYYFVSMHTKDPVTGKSLDIWWKSSLTSLQILQFMTMMCLSAYFLYHSNDTGSFRIAALFFLYILTLFVQFAHFYVKTYMDSEKKRM